MNKVLLISMFPKEEVPYANLYLDVIKENKVAYDIIYWNRDKDGKTEFSDHEITFKLECKTGGPKRKKILKMLKYAKFIRNRMNKEEYSKAIILTTVPGMFLLDILIKKYPDNYILDIRDYTNENNKLYYFFEKKLICNSYYTVISSLGFESFLPKERKYLKVHNISNQDAVKNEIDELNKKEKLMIGFVGNLRYEKENELLISKLKDNLKYEIGYWGKNTNNFSLETIKKRTQAKNVVFFGQFLNEYKREIYEKIDFINAIYGDDGLEVTTAIPNRFYDALIFKKPIITSKGTFIGDLVQKYKLGITVDIINDDLDEMITLFLQNFNPEIFLKTCNELLDVYLEDQYIFKRNVEDFIEIKADK